MNVLIWITCRNYCQQGCEYVCQAIQSAVQGAGTVVVAHDHCGEDHPSGVAETRNRVLAWPRVGEFRYVIFLDADDVMPAGYAQQLLLCADNEDCVVTCDGQAFGDSSERIQVNRPVTLESLLELNTVHVSALIPIASFARHGLFDSNLSAYEDWELWCRLAAAGVPFRHCSKTVLNIRHHSGSRHANKTMTFTETQTLLRTRYDHVALPA